MRSSFADSSVAELEPQPHGGVGELDPRARLLPDGAVPLHERLDVER